MPLVHMIAILVLVAVLMFVINKYGAQWMDATILKILNVAVAIVVILWLIYLILGFAPADIWVGHK